MNYTLDMNHLNEINVLVSWTWRFHVEREPIKLSAFIELVAVVKGISLGKSLLGFIGKGEYETGSGSWALKML